MAVIDPKKLLPESTKTTSILVPKKNVTVTSAGVPALKPAAQPENLGSKLVVKKLIKIDEVLQDTLKVKKDKEKKEKQAENKRRRKEDRPPSDIGGCSVTAEAGPKLSRSRICHFGRSLMRASSYQVFNDRPCSESSTKEFTIVGSTNLRRSTSVNSYKALNKSHSKSFRCTENIAEQSELTKPRALSLGLWQYIR